MAAALLAASRACGDRCEAASANSVCSSRGLSDAMAATATVPQICCSFSSCCCSSVDKFSFKSFAYVGTVSRSSLSVIVRSPLASLINCRPDPELVEGEGPAVRRDSRPAFLRHSQSQNEQAPQITRPVSLRPSSSCTGRVRRSAKHRARAVLPADFFRPKDPSPSRNG